MVSAPMNLDKLDNCPDCGSSWVDKPIPGTDDHYSRLIGVEIRGVYDGVVVWKCPDCGVMTHRESGEKVTEADLESGVVRRFGLKRDEACLGKSGS